MRGALKVVHFGRLYESPFTDFDDQGISGVFRQAEIQKIVKILADVRGKAAA